MKPSEGEKKEEKPRPIDDILQSNIWDVDYEPHIKVEYEKCVACELKPCTKLCPAGCYTLLDNRVLFSYEGCLECGTCRIICPMDAVTWNYPVSGKGIYFRFS